MKFKSQIITQGSGSVGGQTYSHNRGGMYIRARATPTNPNTVFQQTVRGLMSMLTSLWSDTLTQVQRDTWDLYAENVPLPDTLGEPRNVGGIGMYVRSNLPRLQQGLPRVDTGPGIFDLSPFFPVTLGILSEATQIIPIAFNALDAWVTEDDAAMLIWTSRPQNPGVNFFKGPYQLADAILGDSGIPPTTPYTSATAFPFLEDQKVFIRVNVTRADGRLASEFRIGSLAAA